MVKLTSPEGKKFLFFCSVEWTIQCKVRQIFKSELFLTLVERKLKCKEKLYEMLNEAKLKTHFVRYNPSENMFYWRDKKSDNIFVPDQPAFHHKVISAKETFFSDGYIDKKRKKLIDFDDCVWAVDQVLDRRQIQINDAWYIQYLVDFAPFNGLSFEPEWTFEGDMVCTELIDKAERDIIWKLFLSRGEQFKFRNEIKDIPIQRLSLKEAENFHHLINDPDDPVNDFEQGWARRQIEIQLAEDANSSSLSVPIISSSNFLHHSEPNILPHSGPNIESNLLPHFETNFVTKPSSESKNSVLNARLLKCNSLYDSEESLEISNARSNAIDISIQTSPQSDTYSFKLIQTNSSPQSIQSNFNASAVSNTMQKSYEQNNKIKIECLSPIAGISLPPQSNNSINILSKTQRKNKKKRDKQKQLRKLNQEKTSELEELKTAISKGFLIPAPTPSTPPQHQQSTLTKSANKRTFEDEIYQETLAKRTRVQKTLN